MKNVTGKFGYENKNESGEREVIVELALEYEMIIRCKTDCRQVAQLWDRDRASSINDFRWGGSI